MSMGMVVYLKMVGLSTLPYKTPVKGRGMLGMHFSLSPGTCPTPTLVLVEPRRVLTVRADGSRGCLGDIFFFSLTFPS